ncbi:hypothetical protein Ddye_005896 [Dipteronia dyeriana]|uniref:RNase H type-1 domain-containing protein n=1 Tax=Dipteronia dyeriana TaxID=168575 RepID=A0AAD9XI04_9ROSI|nr:hypothetical protein Ddye_005896 [Dipteronia dyeriana]
MKMATVCPIYFRKDETSMHALWHCSSLRNVRAVLSSVGQEKFWDGVSFLDFVLSCKEKMEFMEFELFCVMWWHIWQRRNQMLHSFVLLPDSEIYDRTVGFLAEFRSATKRFESFFSPEIIEAMAILRGLRLALENGLVPMILESDALDLVNKIRSQTVPSSEVGVIIHDILILLGNLDLSSIRFVSRLANKVAHCLAKLALKFLGEFVCWKTVL